MKHLRTLAATVVVLALLAGAAIPFGHAQARLRATVFLVQALIPRLPNERAMLGFARAHNARRLVETTAEPITQRRWLAQLVVSFNAPPGDLEFHVLFYDVEDGPRVFIDDMSTYLNARDQMSYVQNIRLERPKFKPNRRMELVVTVRHNEVGRLAFEMLGEEIHRSGQVDFSDSEARGRTDDPHAHDGTERAGGN